MVRRIAKNEFAFLPLGGSNEIGMNVNLYHYNGKWIMIDLGAGFANPEDFPGVDMLAPDLDFVYQNRKDFLGIVLTHGHEDHLGSIGYLFEKLKLPIWTTPFTAEIVKNKLDQRGAKNKAKINVVQPGARFQIGDFDLEMVQITHSIPEMNGIFLRTPKGNILHTGDWKFDPKPVVSPTTDFDKLKAFGDEGCLAMVCDSTNVFNPKFSGSEEELYPHLKGLVKSQTGLVYVTTFASNVARIETLCKVAKACGRKVVLAGLSLHRITQFAKDAGYLKDIEPFVSDQDVKSYSRNSIMVICTGCQGEERAALTKIANNQHQYLKVTSQDSIIFSSKIIPGNEKKIFALFNKFVRLKCDVFTEKDHQVHVSGHPSREELSKMYELVRPKVAIPVHGEPTHIHEHANLAREVGVPKVVEVQNGEMIRLDENNSGSMLHVNSGYLGVDGAMLQPKEGAVMQIRRKLRDEGICVVGAAIDEDNNILSDIYVKTPGVLDEMENEDFIAYLKDEIEDVILSQPRNLAVEKIVKKVRRSLKKIFSKELSKRPICEIAINRVK